MEEATGGGSVGQGSATGISTATVNSMGKGSATGLSTATVNYLEGNIVDGKQSKPVNEVEYVDIEFDEDCPRRSSFAITASKVRLRVEATPSDITERTSLTLDSYKKRRSTLADKKSDCLPRFPGRRDSLSNPPVAEESDCLPRFPGRRESSSNAPVAEGEEDLNLKKEVDIKPRIPGRRGTVIITPAPSNSFGTQETHDGDQIPRVTMKSNLPNHLSPRTSQTPKRSVRSSITTSSTMKLSPKKSPQALKSPKKSPCNVSRGTPRKFLSLFKNGLTDYGQKCPFRAGDNRPKYPGRRNSNEEQNHHNNSDNSPKYPERTSEHADSRIFDNSPKIPQRTSSQEKPCVHLPSVPFMDEDEKPNFPCQTELESDEERRRPRFPWKRQASHPKVECSEDRPKFPCRQASIFDLECDADDLSNKRGSADTNDKFRWVKVNQKTIHSRENSTSPKQTPHSPINDSNPQKPLRRKTYDQIMLQCESPFLSAKTTKNFVARVGNALTNNIGRKR